ncbi:putative 2OG-Fe(II) oxygenase [Bosea vaviloviae]|uniref:putative 2OG-Fe(II) oxygenase n=1 Tax=Bosea vaviloviae TaxID=1526658 RepID=UPI0009F3861F|nr:putative 2OG-Fe(II) oxygenase [Bosea vaviloviae]
MYAAAEQNVAMDLAWPTIISEAVFEEADQYRDTLINIIERAASRAGVSGQTGRLPELTMRPELVGIRKDLPREWWTFVLKSIQAHLAAVRPGLYPIGSKQVSELWPNIHRIGEFHAPHFHSFERSVLVGTYYVGVPEVRSELEACLALMDPRGRISASAEYNKFHGASEYIVQPVPGKLVLFPPHVVHYVYPHRSTTAVRYSISFNVSKAALAGGTGSADF